jgi:hypothetical protein
MYMYRYLLPLPAGAKSGKVSCVADGKMMGPDENRATQDFGSALFEGDGSQLQINGDELRFTSAGGFNPRQQNVVSLPLDEIQFISLAQGSKPWLLIAALITAPAPLYTGAYLDPTTEDTVLAIAMPLAIVLLILYACTLRTTLIFGCACADSVYPGGANGAHSMTMCCNSPWPCRV